MNCDEAREQIGSDPGNVSAELDSHLQGCTECRAYREQVQAFDARIRRALELRPELLRGAAHNTAALSLRRDAGRPYRRQRPSQMIAIGTSLAAGLLVAFTLWLGRPSVSLASEVVAHVEGEPKSWSRTESVTAEELDAVLKKAGVRLGPGLGPVVYASSCWFRGRYVPHLVVTTTSGPVTVMILQHETIPTPQSFNEDGYSGVLVPAPQGSVAVLSRKPMPLDDPAKDALRALQAAPTK